MMPYGTPEPVFRTSKKYIHISISNKLLFYHVARDLLFPKSHFPSISMDLDIEFVNSAAVPYVNAIRNGTSKIDLI